MFLKVKLLHICKLVPTIYILINISQSPILIYSISPRPATFLIDQSFRFCIIYIAYVKFRKKLVRTNNQLFSRPEDTAIQSWLSLMIQQDRRFQTKAVHPKCETWPYCWRPKFSGILSFDRTGTAPLTVLKCLQILQSLWTSSHVTFVCNLQSETLNTLLHLQDGIRLSLS